LFIIKEAVNKNAQKLIKIFGLKSDSKLSLALTKTLSWFFREKKKVFKSVVKPPKKA